MAYINKDAMGEAVGRIGCLAVVIAIAALMVVAMGGCRTIEVTREVPVITEHTTEHHHTDIVRDTLMMRDSIYHYVMGDTVIIERWHRIVNINKTVVGDTIRDTIPQVVTVTRTEVKEVNRLHWWQKALMWAGVAGIGAGVLLMVCWRKRAA